jgi:hypothetical protein
MKRYILLAVLLLPNIALAQTEKERLLDRCKADLLTKYNGVERDIMISVRDVNKNCTCIINRIFWGLPTYGCPKKIGAVERSVLRREGFVLMR